MERYSELRMIGNGVTLTIESDQTGFVSEYMGEKLFDFSTIKELKTMLRKAPDTELAFELLHEN